MSSTLEMLKARQAAEAAAKAAQEGNKDDAASGDTAADSVLVIDPVAGAMKMPSDKVIVKVAEPVVAPKGPPGSYRALRLQRFFDAKGTKIEPNSDGFFIPANQEQAEILAHFATTQYDMVEYQDAPEEQKPE